LKKSSEKKVETRSKAKILADKFTELLKWQLPSLNGLIFQVR
jgi:hypothetical protein